MEKEVKVFVLVMLLFIPLSTVFSQEDDGSFAELINKAVENSEQLPEDFSFMYPMSAEVKISDTGEEITVQLNEEGYLTVVDDLKKPDIEVQGTNEEFLKLTSSRGQSEIKTNLQESDIKVKANTIKGQVVVGAAEEVLDVKLTEKKGFWQNLVSFLARIISSFVEK